jgi:AAA ATPase domain
MAAAEDRIRLVLVSPGDVAAERAAAQRVVAQLNRTVAANRLVLWRWETDARPGLHPQGAQGLIDDLMDLPNAAVVIGVFWTRFGTPTDDANSGTEHELRRAWAAWREHGRPDVMVYFSSRAYAPQNADELLQWQRVLEFKDELPRELLWWSYTTPRAFEALLREHLTRYLRDRDGRPTPRPPRADDSDSSGASALLLTDAAGADAQQRERHSHLVRSAVAAHGGRNAEVHDEASIAVFRSAAKAASCAVALQQAAARHNRRHPEDRIAVRIALDLLEPAPSGELVLRAVSLTRRICGRARPGQILATAPLSAAVAGAGEYRFRAPADGDAPVELVWEQTAQLPFPLPSALSNGERGVFVGREPDLAHLRGEYTQATRAGPRLTLIYGEPGIGKTRLATEFALRARADGAIVLYGRCDEEPWLPQQPFVEALRHYVETMPLPQLMGQMRPVSGEAPGAA